MERSISHWNFPKSIQTFFSDLKKAKQTSLRVNEGYRRTHPLKNEKDRSFAWIQAKSTLPWLPLDIAFPAREMLEEAKRVRHRFVAHRADKSDRTYVGQGWKALALHGISPEATADFHQYGYKTHEEAPYHWTEIAKQCPITTKFLKSVFPHGTYHRVRFSLLEPGGFLLPHDDRKEHLLFEVNIALNHPKGCYFKLKNVGYVPQKAGRATILDVAHMHSVINTSNVDRYHIIVHGVHLRSPAWQEMIQRSYQKFLRGKNY